MYSILTNGGFNAKYINHIGVGVDNHRSIRC